ncbi:hypothetical protein GCM10009754_35770 [Amycolatopsis minnesotensis]|uniref:Lsr2 DNA-binding domain-containing protein n=1 Tax=Amycolatopsis minnesotensis TaxID=337894 RepID=A0ABP5CCD0_9PSEU
MGKVALIVVVEGEGGPCDNHRRTTDGRPATLYHVDLDSARGEDDVHHVLARHRRTPKRRPGGNTARNGPEEDAATVREWAREHDLPVSARGRISAEIRREYKAHMALSDSFTVADAVKEAEEESQKVVQMRLHRERGKDDDAT